MLERADIAVIHPIVADRRARTRRQITLAPRPPQYDAAGSPPRQLARARAGRRDNIDRRPTVGKSGGSCASRQTADIVIALDLAGKPTFHKKSELLPHPPSSRPQGFRPARARAPTTRATRPHCRVPPTIAPTRSPPVMRAPSNPKLAMLGDSVLLSM